MTKTFSLCICGVVAAGGLLIGLSHPALPVFAAPVVPASHGGTLLRQNFDGANGWPQMRSAASPKAGVKVTAAWKPVGTVDEADTTTASGGLVLSIETTPPLKSPWVASLTSGLLPVRTTETNLGKLTLGFSLSAPSVRPIAVRIESFDAKKHRTGGLTGLIYPAAPDFYQRYALDLSALKPIGAGKFQPTAPLVLFTFETSGTSAPVGKQELRLDNVNYSSPAYYVSPSGDDKNDGRTEKTAFATPQKALDVAQPGDIVLLMDGTYKGGNSNVASFRRPGAPDAWIVLKNYPGHKPLLTSTGWNIVSVSQGSKENISDLPALAYLEVRGLHVRGEGDVAKTKYPDAMNKGDSRTNSNGIAIDSRFSKHVFHHLRLADNVVEYCPGQGLGSIDGDWVTIENNVSQNNCWTTIYATSGISEMGSANFDLQDNVYKRLVRNNVVCHNQTFEKWAAIGRYSDGNGIILDVNQHTDVNQGVDTHPNQKYIGRTLVQSNLCYDNGGSGIHTVSADRVDIIGNTVYLNSASVNLEYGEIFTYGSNDVRIINNIMVAPTADVAGGKKPEPMNKLGGKNTGVVFSHNLYFGGNIPPIMGDGDVIADPKFIAPTIDSKTANFHLRPDSPAIGTGISFPFAPFLDLDGKPRKAIPSKGTYEK